MYSKQINLLPGETKIPLGGLERKQLPWTRLPKMLSDHGWELENWPGGVPLPGTGSPLCDDNKAVNGLNTKHLSLLYAAVKSEDCRLRFRKVTKVPGSCEPPNVGGPTLITGSHLPPGSTGPFGGSEGPTWVPLGASRRRDHEDDDEGNRRGDKRPRVMGDQ